MQTLEQLPFVGGNPALDFTNTAEERGHPLCGDVLLGPGDLRRWGERYGILDASGDDDDGDELARALQARELLYRLWSARVGGLADDPSDLRRLTELAAQAHGAGSLMAADDGRLVWRWERSELASVRHVAVTSALELLTTSATPRLKQCPGEHCGWFFLDTTKRGNRRWCEMSGCGQDAKTAKRRERATATATAAGTATAHG